MFVKKTLVGTFLLIVFIRSCNPYSLLKVQAKLCSEKDLYFLNIMYFEKYYKN